MLSVGLTGGIGCGKSTVARTFAALGVPVIDADLIARELVRPGSPALAAIVRAFGPGVLTVSGELDRRALRERVFRDPEARARLEALLHPLVREAIAARRREIRAPYCLIVVPLLIEAGMTDLVDRVLVVDCDPEQQLKRVCARDGVEPAQVRAIMQAQADRGTRLAAADDVIENRGSEAELERSVRALHRRYLDLAAAGG